MWENIKKVFFGLLRFEFEMLFSQEFKYLITSERLPAFFKLSKQHDLAHLIGDALDKNGLLSDTTEVKKRFLQERNMAVYRYEQQQYELEQICNTLNEAKIPFIPLKGSVIRQYYPEPWMRTSCDIDILIHKKDLERASVVLKTRLNYSIGTMGDHDISLIAESGVHLELHYQLLEEGAKDSEKTIFNDVWEVVSNEDLAENFYFKMPDEYFYCYHISHIAKHLKYGGCGVRSILDTWILNHKVEYNKNIRDNLLKEAGLLSVARAIENLAEVWFSEVETDELSDTLGEYILTGGTYGTFDNKVAAQQSRKKNKFTYLLSRLFLPYAQMKFKYPKLQKWPILYPFYVIKRCFLLFNKEKRNLATRELNQTTNGDTESQQKIANLLKELDL